MYKDIVLPIDGTDISTVAIEEVIKLSRENNLTVHGVYVDPRAAEDSYRGEKNFDEDVSKLPELEQKAEQHGIECDTTVVGSRKSHKGICEYADEIDADAILMSTHSRKGFLDNLLFTSVTESTIKKAPCPVIAIPNP